MSYHVLGPTVVAGCGVIERSSRHSNRVMRAEDDHVPLPGERVIWSELPSPHRGPDHRGACHVRAEHGKERTTVLQLTQPRVSAGMFARFGLESFEQESTRAVPVDLLFYVMAEQPLALPEVRPSVIAHLCPLAGRLAARFSHLAAT